MELLRLHLRRCPMERCMIGPWPGFRVSPVQGWGHRGTRGRLFPTCLSFLNQISTTLVAKLSGKCSISPLLPLVGRRAHTTKRFAGALRPIVGISATATGCFPGSFPVKTLNASSSAPNHKLRKTNRFSDNELLKMEYPLYVSNPCTGTALIISFSELCKGMPLEIPVGVQHTRISH